ncbi:lipoprotein [Nitrospira sp.]|nr:lipoprotein [Nitrospira sp.]
MRILVPIVFLLATSGCVSSGNPSVLDENAVAQIKEGVTTKQDVKQLLGNPTSIGRGSGSMPLGALPVSLPPGKYEVWVYNHMSVETHPATFIPVVGLFAGGATASTTSLTVYFDGQGVVQYVQTTQSQSTSEMGSSSLQPDGSSADAY